MAEAQGDSILLTNWRVFIAEIYLSTGRVSAAEALVLSIRDAAHLTPLLESWRLSLLVWTRLARGRVGEAREIAERTVAQTRSSGVSYCVGHAKLLLLRAEAHHAFGDHDMACHALREARDDLLRRAAKIPDSEPEVRRCFLENLPDHRRTLELAREWLGDA